MTGVIKYLHDGGHTGVIRGADGLDYFLYRSNVQQFSPVPWRQARVGQRCEFTPVESDRAKDDDRAIEVRIFVEPPDGV